MKTIAVTIILASLLFSCKLHGKKIDGNDAEVKNGVRTYVQNDSIKSLDTTITHSIYDNAFISRTTERDLIWRNIINHYKPKILSKSLSPNGYNPNKQDTLVRFNERGDSILFYKGWSNSFAKRIVLTSDLMSIDSDIRIGMNKESLCSKFKLKKISDQFAVMEETGYVKFTFQFNQGKLIKIVYELTYSD